MLIANNEAPFGGIMSSPMVMIVVFMVLFWVLFIRPQAKAQKLLRKKIEAMKIGDRVKTAGGMYGVIDRIRDNVVFIKCGDTIIEFDKQAIVDVLDKSEQ